MAIQPYTKIRTGDKNLIELQDNVEQPLKDISSRAILDGQLLENIELLTSQDNIINHKLQRKLRGYLVVLQSAQANIWDDQANNQRPNQTVILNTSADVTVTLWVF